MPRSDMPRSDVAQEQLPLDHRLLGHHHLEHAAPRREVEPPPDIDRLGAQLGDRNRPCRRDRPRRAGNAERRGGQHQRAARDQHRRRIGDVVEADRLAAQQLAGRQRAVGRQPRFREPAAEMVGGCAQGDRVAAVGRQEPALGIDAPRRAAVPAGDGIAALVDRVEPQTGGAGEQHVADPGRQPPPAHRPARRGFGVDADALLYVAADRLQGVAVGEAPRPIDRHVYAAAAEGCSPARRLAPPVVHAHGHHRQIHRPHQLLDAGQDRQRPTVPGPFTFGEQSDRAAQVSPAAQAKDRAGIGGVLALRHRAEEAVHPADRPSGERQLGRQEVDGAPRGQRQEHRVPERGVVGQDQRRLAQRLGRSEGGAHQGPHAIADQRAEPPHARFDAAAVERRRRQRGQAPPNPHQAAGGRGAYCCR